MYTAYFDRKTENHEAILLVEALQQDFTFPLSSLPAASEPGDWFLVAISDGKITDIVSDSNKTNQMKKEIDNRMARLQAKKRSRFKR